MVYITFSLYKCSFDRLYHFSKGRTVLCALIILHITCTYGRSCRYNIRHGTFRYSGFTSVIAWVEFQKYVSFTIHILS